jgi:transcriptional regulator with XRE-family HTH domain
MRSKGVPEKQVQAAVERVNSGETQRAVAKDLGVPAQTLNGWVMRARELEATPFTQQREKPQGRPSGGARVASEMFGKVLARLRYERVKPGGTPMTTDAFARRLNMPPSTLRTLQSGNATPQTSLAIALSQECGLSLPTVMLFIAYVRAYEDSMSETTAQQLGQALTEGDARFRFVAQRLQLARSMATLARSTLFKDPDFLDQVLRLLRSSSSRGMQPIEADLGLLSSLSPVILDAIATLGERLRLFQPALDETGLANWEQTNQYRIQRVLAYYSNPKVLLETINSFTCDFLRHSKAGLRYLVLLREADNSTVEHIRKELYRKVADLPEDCIDVRCLKITQALTISFENALSFDTATSKLLDPTGATAMALPGRGIVQMRTVNLYELQTTHELGGSTGLLRCAFVDNKQPWRPGSDDDVAPDGIHYTRALPTDDVRSLEKLFEQALDPGQRT